jgi:hypothetical protein
MNKSEVFRGMGNNVEWGAMREVPREEQLRFGSDLEEIIKREFSRNIAKGIEQKLVLETADGFRQGDIVYRTNIYILTDEELRAIVHNVKEQTLLEVSRLQKLIPERDTSN